MIDLTYKPSFASPKLRHINGRESMPRVLCPRVVLSDCGQGAMHKYSYVLRVYVTSKHALVDNWISIHLEYDEPRNFRWAGGLLMATAANGNYNYPVIL